MGNHPAPLHCKLIFSGITKKIIKQIIKKIIKSIENQIKNQIKNQNPVPGGCRLPGPGAGRGPGAGGRILIFFDLFLFFIWFFTGPARKPGPGNRHPPGTGILIFLIIFKYASFFIWFYFWFFIWFFPNFSKTNRLAVAPFLTPPPLILGGGSYLKPATFCETRRGADPGDTGLHGRT